MRFTSKGLCMGFHFYWGAQPVWWLSWQRKEEYKEAALLYMPVIGLHKRVNDQ